MLATKLLRRMLAIVAAIALLVASMHARATFAAAPITIIGVVDNTDAIASCSLRIDPDTKMVTPLVTMQPPPRTSSVDVRFRFFDSSGTPAGTQDVSVPPPSFGPVLASFPLQVQIASAHCDLKPPDSPSNSPSAGATGGGGGGGATLAILGGVLAVGAIAAAAGGHGGGGGSPSSSPITAPPSQPTPTPAPTKKPVQTPTPVTTPSPVHTASPAPTATATGPTPTPTPSATPAPGPIVLTPSSLSFTSTGTAYNQTSTASETHYTGTFSSTATTCGGIATIAAGGATFTVTPQGAGTCAFTISDTHGQTAQLSVTVTVSSGTIEGHRQSAPLPKPHS